MSMHSYNALPQSPGQTRKGIASIIPRYIEDFEETSQIKNPFADSTNHFQDIEHESENPHQNGETFLLQLLQKNQKPISIGKQSLQMIEQQTETLNSKDSMIDRLKSELFEANTTIQKQREEIIRLNARITSLVEENRVNGVTLQSYTFPYKNQQAPLKAVAERQRQKFSPELAPEINMDSLTTPVLSLMGSEVFQIANGTGNGGGLSNEGEIASIMNLSPIKRKSTKQQDRSTFCDRSCFQDIMKISDHQQQQQQQHDTTNAIDAINQQDQNTEGQQQLRPPSIQSKDRINIENYSKAANEIPPTEKKSNQPHWLLKSNSDSLKLYEKSVASNSTAHQPNNQAEQHQPKQLQIHTTADPANFKPIASTRTRSTTNAIARPILDTLLESESQNTLLTRSQTTKNSSNTNQSNHQQNQHQQQRFTFNFPEDHQQTTTTTVRPSSINSIGSSSISTLYCDFLRKCQPDNLAPSQQESSKSKSFIPKKSCESLISRNQFDHSQQSNNNPRKQPNPLSTSSNQHDDIVPSQIHNQPIRRAGFSGDLELQDALFNNPFRCNTEQSSSYLNQNSAQRLKSSKDYSHKPLIQQQKLQPQIQQQQFEEPTRSSLNLLSLQQSNSYHIHPKKYIETKHETNYQQLNSDHILLPSSSSSNQSKNLRAYYAATTTSGASKRADYQPLNGQVISPTAANQIKISYSLNPTNGMENNNNSNNQRKNNNNTTQEDRNAQVQVTLQPQSIPTESRQSKRSLQPSHSYIISGSSSSSSDQQPTQIVAQTSNALQSSKGVSRTQYKENTTYRYSQDITSSRQQANTVYGNYLQPSSRQEEKIQGSSSIYEQNSRSTNQTNNLTPTAAAAAAGQLEFQQFKQARTNSANGFVCPDKSRISKGKAASGNDENYEQIQQQQHHLPSASKTFLHPSSDQLDRHNILRESTIQRGSNANQRNHIETQQYERVSSKASSQRTSSNNYPVQRKSFIDK